MKISKEHLSRDLSASLVVFLVALPLCLGIAVASGAPPLSGLIAGIVGGTVVGFISGSRIGVSGPAAGLTAVVLAAISELGGLEVFLAAVIVGGVIQFIMGLVKAGVIGQYIPNAVIKGMLAAIGIILILKQFPHAIGYDADPEGDLSFVAPNGETTFSPFTHIWELITPGALIISSVSLFLLLGWDYFTNKFAKKLKILPGALMAVVGGIGINQLFLLINPEMAIGGQHMVKVPSFASGDSALVFPDWSAFSNPQIYVVGVTIAIVASLETLLCVEATDRLDPEKSKTPKNRELLAQGTGNIVSGLIGGLPITQVIIRSTANTTANAATKRSAIFHGFLIIFCVLLIPNILNLIPLASLAAILLVVGYKLSSFAIIKGMYSKGWSQFVPFAATIVGILLTDLLIGIGIGLVVAVAFLLWSHVRQHQMSVREEDSNDKGAPGMIHLTLAQELTFMKKANIKKFLENAPNGSTIRIDARQNSYMDHDIMDLFEDFEQEAADKHIRLEWIHKDHIRIREKEHEEVRPHDQEIQLQPDPIESMTSS